MGKIQEISVTGATSNIVYPDINGSPILHTDVELRDIGVKMAEHIASIFTLGATTKATINALVNPTVSDIETELMNFKTSLNTI